MKRAYVDENDVPADKEQTQLLNVKRRPTLSPIANIPVPAPHSQPDSLQIHKLDFADFEIALIDQLDNQLRLTCWRICKNQRSTKSVVIFLHDFWGQTKLRLNGKIRVFAPNVEEDLIQITDKQNYLIVSPDTLVQCTAVASGVYCRRKVILNER